MYGSFYCGMVGMVWPIFGMHKILLPLNGCYGMHKILHSLTHQNITSVDEVSYYNANPLTPLP